MRDGHHICSTTVWPAGFFLLQNRRHINSVGQLRISFSVLRTFKTRITSTPVPTERQEPWPSCWNIRTFSPPHVDFLCARLQKNKDSRPKQPPSRLNRTGKSSSIPVSNMVIALSIILFSPLVYYYNFSLFSPGPLSIPRVRKVVAVSKEALGCQFKGSSKGYRRGAFMM